MSNDIQQINNNFTEMPIIPLRGLVVFPNMKLHFDVGRKKSISALKFAMSKNQNIFLVSQRDSSVDNPELADMYDFGVICHIKQMIKIPNSSNMRVIVEGKRRAALVSIIQDKPFIAGVVDTLDDYSSGDSISELAYIHTVKQEFESYAGMLSKISGEVVSKIISIDELGELCDYVCSNTFFDYPQKQAVLEQLDIINRAKVLVTQLRKEIITLDMEVKIQKQVQEEIDKNQKEYFLREEMKVISDQLGEGENPLEESYRYKDIISKLDCSDEIKDKLYKECDKLIKMPQGSHEGTVVRNYLDKCLELPFGKFTKESINLQRSMNILNSDHYGLTKVKERIVESLAVYKRNPDYSGQILCLYGPPGVGKTSIVKSLAKSMNRKYVRVALGGIHDEAEIRGHRKTYIGAMPGKIIDAIIKSGVMNPIILLDEIDKVGNDYKGDPASALLEALDPEQNNSFTDHYIDFPVDLSKVMFITTANDISTISAPLLDRMEIIELNSYTIDEKFNIAKKHLLKEELKKHKLNMRQFKITDDAIYSLIDHYTKEAGVRGLKNQLSTLCRKATVALDSGAKSFKITRDNLKDYLGVEKYGKDFSSISNEIGTVNGLAWTQVGGTILPIEVSAVEGTGKIELTGNLGDVMKESAKTAVTFVRYRAADFGIASDFYKTKDIHIHAPEAAIPKDGPSAGLALTTAIVSELSGIPIKSNVAMTGEISLKGKALPIGGLKEKSMAAYKAGCDTVIIPRDNAKDLAEISDEVKESVTFVTVSSFDEVMPIALISMPKANDKASIIADSNNDTQVITQ
ncbi:MAG: endopeptidase La [Eubacterium sp.]